MKDNWGRYKVYKIILIVFFGIGLWLDVINEKLLENVIPQEIVLGLSCLSIGLWLGFEISNYEVRRVYKLNKRQENN